MQFPGFFIPKPTKKTLKTLQSSTGLTSDKRDLIIAYIRRLADYQYLIQHAAFKQFMEKKMDIKKHIVEASGLNPAQVAGTYQDNPFEIAERLRESFPYLMEVPVQEQDYKQIEKFEAFIARKLTELDGLKSELKTILSKCVTEYRAEGKLI